MPLKSLRGTKTFAARAFNQASFGLLRKLQALIKVTVSNITPTLQLQSQAFKRYVDETMAVIGLTKLEPTITVSNGSGWMIKLTTVETSLTLKDVSVIAESYCTGLDTVVTGPGSIELLNVTESIHVV